MAWNFNNVTGTGSQTIEQLKRKAGDLDERVTDLEDAPAGGGFVPFDAGDVSQTQTTYGNGYNDAIHLPNTPSAEIKASDMVKLTMYGEIIGSSDTYIFNLIRSGGVYMGHYMEGAGANPVTVVWGPNDNIIYYIS